MKKKREKKKEVFKTNVFELVDIGRSITENFHD